MVDTIAKETAYVIGNDGGGVNSARGYAVSVPHVGAAVVDSSGYGITHTPDSIVATSSYSVLVQPASIPDSTTYVLAASALRESSLTDSKGYVVLYSFFPPNQDVLNDVSFVEQQFPVCVSFGSSGGPGFKTSIFEVDSGLTATEIDWDRIRSRYNAVFDHVPPSDIEQVENFFYGMRGRGTGFRYKDWSDYTIANQNVLVGDGVTTSFQLFKRYNSGGNIFDRIIRKPIPSTVQMTLNGVTLIRDQDFFISESTGMITFPTPPPQNQLGVIVQAEFDVPVRFDTDYLDVSYDDHQQLNISSLPLIEIIT